MLIVIEGLDGAGKSTQVRKLKEYLEGVCKPFEYIHFPRYNAPVYGELISRFLRGDFGTIDGVHPQLVALLFAEDRHSAVPQINNILKQGGTVLLDRYVNSNIAYQCSKLSSEDDREELREWITKTEYNDFSLPRPDLNIFLDTPISFVERQLAKDRMGQDRKYLEGSTDIHEADIAFQRRVREIYLQLCEADTMFVRVDCADGEGNMLAPEEIFAKIQKEVEVVLKNRCE